MVVAELYEILGFRDKCLLVVGRDIADIMSSVGENWEAKSYLILSLYGFSNLNSLFVLIEPLRGWFISCDFIIILVVKRADLRPIVSACVDNWFISGCLILRNYDVLIFLSGTYCSFVGLSLIGLVIFLWVDG